MNKLYKILAGVMIFTGLISCDLNEIPEFDPADSYVSFSVAEVTKSESAGKISIPISIASVDAIKTMVTYEVVDGTAKLGKDYSLVDPSAVVTFDGKAREGVIELNITDNSGVYTGDVKFTINLVSGGPDLNVGSESICEVTITDNDHPLAAILGEYEASATDFFAGAAASWNLTLTKDAEKIDLVWIKGLTPALIGFPNSEFYGTVSPDLKVITIPCGQKTAFIYPGAGPLSIGLLDADAGTFSEGGDIVMTMNSDGVFTTPAGVYCYITEMAGPNGVDGIVNDGKFKWTKK